MIRIFVIEIMIDVKLIIVAWVSVDAVSGWASNSRSSTGREVRNPGLAII